MKAVAYSIVLVEKELLVKANAKRHEITMISNPLSLDVINYAMGKEAILVSAHDDISMPVIGKLKEIGIKYIITRSYGASGIDILESINKEMEVAHVADFSTERVAAYCIQHLDAWGR